LATEPLFDLASIDLTQVLMDADGIEAINPQRGHMRHLDAVIWLSQSKDDILGVKHVREDEFWVPGHIPGRPLLPGVLMIEAGAQLSAVLYNIQVPKVRFIGFTRCDEVSFRSQVVPGDTLYLLAQKLKFGTRHFTAYTQGIVNGKVAFESKIAGMTL
jgi:3-hydroxyacyl-[acyl-carrier-protein] dehydratase